MGQEGGGRKLTSAPSLWDRFLRGGGGGVYLLLHPLEQALAVLVAPLVYLDFPDLLNREVVEVLGYLLDTEFVVVLDRRQALSPASGVLGVGELGVHEAHVGAHPLLGHLLELLELLLLLLGLGHELLGDLLEGLLQLLLLLLGLLGEVGGRGVQKLHVGAHRTLDELPQAPVLLLGLLRPKLHRGAEAMRPPPERLCAVLGQSFGLLYLLLRHADLRVLSSVMVGHEWVLP